MNSIYSTLKGLLKDGKPVDFLATWRKTLSMAAEREIALFQKVYSDDWFTYNAPQMSLTAEAIQGKRNIRIMATLLANESPTPLRRSDGFDVWTNEIPRVGHKFFMSARTFRKLQEVYENPRLSDAQKVKEIEKTLTTDVQGAYMGCKDVMDYIVLNALSNFGVAKFTPAVNNPGGRQFEIDYNMDAANKIVAAYNWTSANSKAGKVNIILEISKIVNDYRLRGIEFGEILMSQDVYYSILMDEGVRLMVKGTDKKASLVSKVELEAILASNDLPPITIVSRKMGIDKDGERSSIDPWNHNVIVFKPSGVIGEIQPAIEDSELMEEPNVDYMDAGNGIRIAKWRTGESTGQVAGEYTQGSGRLLPLITDVNSIVCYQIKGFTEKSVPNDAEGNARSYWPKAEYDAAT